MQYVSGNMELAWVNGRAICILLELLSNRNDSLELTAFLFPNGFTNSAVE
jgi:hypothetical protein